MTKAAEGAADAPAGGAMAHDAAGRAEPLLLSGRPQGKLVTIYEAAAEVFVRDGYAGATSKALAAAAGVAESTLFRLASDKESLYFHLFDFAWSEINALVADAAFVADVDAPERTTDPAEVLVADGRAIAALFDDTRRRPLVAFAFDALARCPEPLAPLNSPPYARFRRRVVSHVALHQRRSGLGGRAVTAPEEVADALLARLISAWMAWYYTPEVIAVRRPTVEELTDQLRADLGLDRLAGDQASEVDTASARGADNGRGRRAAS